MKVLFLGRGNNQPATRYRIEQFLPYLRAQGMEEDLVYFPDSLWDWWHLTNSKKHYDIVFIQKKRVSSFWLKRFKKSGARIIYDFDDAVMFASSRHATPESPARMAQFIRMVRASDAVIAGNVYLKSQAEPYHQRIYIIPTAMDLTKYASKETRAKSIDEPITLGWIGGGKSLVFLKALLPVLEDLSTRFKIQLKIVCDRFFTSDKLKIIAKPWAEPEEGADMATFDIGLAPLPDDPWSRGKCAAKLLQYMAAGVPGVASPVGVHTEIIQEGVNGFLAKDNAEWTAKLSRLITDAALRRSLGAAARRTVEERYSMAVNAPRLLEIFQDIIGKSSS